VKSDKIKIKEILNELKDLYKRTLGNINLIIEQASMGIRPYIKENKTELLRKEYELKESLVKEIKDFDPVSTIVLIELVKILSAEKTQWFPIDEVCEKISNKMSKDINEVEKILMTIAEKGFIVLGIGF